MRKDSELLNRTCPMWMAAAVVALLLVGGSGTAALADDDKGHTLNWPTGEIQTYRLESGPLANDSANYAVVRSDVVTVERAAWLRLYFRDVELPAGSFIRMTAARDGEVQELDSAGLELWSNSSAYFNGDTVYLDLVAAPHTSRNQISVYSVGTAIRSAERSCGGDGCGICGADNRVPSTEAWTGRLMPVGCTASVYSEASCLVSAGHCAQSGLVCQFNVPNSDSNCDLNNPPVADQFPITTFQYNNGGVGADWSVMLTGNNNQGQKPYQRYGVLRPISGTLANAGNPATVCGYGIDDDQNNRNQTQQTHTGTILSRASTYYTFNVDMTYGDSGSALIVNDMIVGIVTHCSYSCENWATRIDLSAFAAARNSLCADNTPPEPNPMTFATLPNPISTSSIAMAATTATDATPPVQYEFDFVSGGSGGDDRTWSALTTYTDSGLQPNTDYTYRVRARDSAATPNMTAYSTPATTATFIQTPWGVSFGAATASTIELIGEGTFTNLGEGQSGLWFESTTPGGNGGIATWVQSTTDQATGLGPDTLYTFQLKARNRNGLETAFTATASAATLANEPAAPTLTNPTSSSLRIDVNANGNPAYTTFAIQCTAADPPDAAWQGRWATAAGQPGAAELWQTDAQWGTLTLGQMQPATTYTFAVKALNQDDTQTALGPSAALATLALVPAAPALSNATQNSMDIDVNPNGNPAGTTFAIQCTATNPNDAAWLGKWAGAAGQPGLVETWQIDAQWSTLTLGQMQPATTYTFAVKARNPQNVETALGPGGSLATSSQSALGDLNCDGIVDFDDIIPFVTALSDPAAYQAAFPDCNIFNGDCDFSGVVDFDDINCFVALLSR